MGNYINRTIITAGLFTILGAYFGMSAPADASTNVIELAPVVIYANEDEPVCATARACGNVAFDWEQGR